MPPVVRRRSGIPPGRCSSAAFCGTAAPFDIDEATGAFVEHDLVKALRELPDEARGWLDGKAHRPVPELQGGLGLRCRHAPGRTATSAVRAALLDYQEIKAPIRPQGVLPFKVDAGARPRDSPPVVQGSMARALESGVKALIDRIHGLYVPYWTFDAHAVCPWEAEAGHYYYTTEHYRDNQGRSQTRQVRHVRWEPAVRRRRALLRR